MLFGDWIGARTQCPEKRLETLSAEEYRWTQACLRQEARPTASGNDARRNVRGSDAAAQEAKKKEPLNAVKSRP